jgi:fibronectin type 3 domain-containing protein
MSKTAGMVCLTGAVWFSCVASGLSFPAPSNVTASWGSYTNEIVITWDSVGAGAWYCVYRVNESDIPMALGGWTNVTVYTHAAPERGAVHRYQVRSATASSGAEASTNSLPYALGFVGFPLSDVPFPGLQFTAGGDAAWAGQYAENGVAKQLVSGRITHSQESWVETAVTGPGRLAFYWRTDSQPSWDALEFSVNGVPVSGARISSNPGWIPYTYDVVGEGDTVLRWTYKKNGSVSTGMDCGWLKDVVWTPTTQEVLDAPLGVCASDGSHPDYIRITWEAVADATHYQVLRSATPEGAKEIRGETWMTGCEYVDWGFTPGVTYYYFVRAAADETGKQGSGYSQPDTGFSPGRPPNDTYSQAVVLDKPFGGSVRGDCTWGSVQAGEPPHGGYADATNSVWWSWTSATNAAVTFEVQGSASGYQAVLAVYTNAGGAVGTLAGIEGVREEADGWTGVTFDAREGATYYIAVAGRGGIGSPVALRWAIDDWVCAAPENVQATDGTLFETVRMTWDAVPGATHYEVWRQTDPRRPDMVRAGTWMTGCVFEDATAKIGVTYRYFVKAATDAEGWLEGPFSESDTGCSAGRPPNDNRVSAGALTGLCGQAQGNSALAAAEPGEPLHAGAAGAVNSVWWTWTAPADASFTFTATPQTNAAWRPVLAVYTNAVDGGGLLPVAHGVAGTDGAKAQAAFDAAAGGTYYVAVAGGDGAGGTFALEWALSLAPPAGVTATEGTAFWVTVIEWEEVAGATRYEVSRAETPDGEKVNLSGWITGRRFEDWTGELAVPYYYFVRAGTEAWGGIESGYSQPLAGWAGDFPPNDDRADAELLEGASGSVPGNSLWATREPGEPQHNGFSDAGHSVWWRWMAPVSAPVTFAARGDGGFDAVVAVYADASGGALAPVAAASGGGASDAELTFGVQSGTEYWIAVAGRPDAGGPVTLEWSYGGWVFPAPSGVAATQAATDGRIEVTWNPVAEATVYEVSRATSADGVKTVVMAWSDELAFVDADVAAGQRYYYFVRAAWDASATLAGVYSGPAEGWIKDDEPPVPPAISGFSPVTLAGGPGFRFTLAVQAGVTYEVVTADELGGGAAWRPLAPPVRAVAADDGPIHLDVPFDAARPRGFFKIEASR